MAENAQLEVRNGELQAQNKELHAVDMVVICPMQMEDGRPLEPRIRRLHPIPFS